MQTYTKFEEKELANLIAEPDAEYTVKDYLSWRFEEVVELIRGRVFRMATAPSTKHQEISGFLFSTLFQFLRKKL